MRILCGFSYIAIKILIWTCLIIKINAAEDEIKFYLDSEDDDVTPIRTESELPKTGVSISTESAGISFFAKKEPQAEVLKFEYGCPVNHTRPCVPKCCDLYQSFKPENKSQCVLSDDEFSPEFKDCPNYMDEVGSLPVEERYEYFIGNPCTRGK